MLFPFLVVCVVFVLLFLYPAFRYFKISKSREGFVGRPKVIFRDIVFIVALCVGLSSTPTVAMEFFAEDPGSAASVGLFTAALALVLCVCGQLSHGFIERELGCELTLAAAATITACGSCVFAAINAKKWGGLERPALQLMRISNTIFAIGGFILLLLLRLSSPSSRRNSLLASTAGGIAKVLESMTKNAVDISQVYWDDWSHERKEAYLKACKAVIDNIEVISRIVEENTAGEMQSDGGGGADEEEGVGGQHDRRKDKKKDEKKEMEREAKEQKKKEKKDTGENMEKGKEKGKEVKKGTDKKTDKLTNKEMNKGSDKKTDMEMHKAMNKGRDETDIETRHPFDPNRPGPSWRFADYEQQGEHEMDDVPFGDLNKDSGRRK